MSLAQFSARLALVGVALMAGSALAEEKAPPPFKCPKLSKKLTTQEVFNARMEALKAGNVDLSFCYYDEKAFVLMPGVVIRGRENVKAAFKQFGSQVGAGVPEPTSLIIEGDVVFATFTLKTSTASIPDGADTFVIREGRIQTQVVHATVVSAKPPAAPASP